MRDVFFYLLCLAGLAVLSWIATGFVEGHATALLVTALMAIAFVTGFAELHRQRVLLGRLRSQLTGTPASPEQWCQGLPESVQGAVRQQIEGLRAALPAPVRICHQTSAVHPSIAAYGSA